MDFASFVFYFLCQDLIILQVNFTRSVIAFSLLDMMPLYNTFNESKVRCGSTMELN